MSAKYRQCRMRKPIDDGSVEQTAFIPGEFAKLGAVLKIRPHGGDWVDGWVVEQVYDHDTILSAGLPDVQAGIRQHRKRTGDSLPKRQ